MTSAPDSALIRAMPAVFVLIWSTGFIVARFGMPYAPPITFLSWRYALSIACFLVWIAFAKVRWPATPAQWGHLAVTGTLMHACYLGGVWVAVKWGMGAGLSSLIVGLQPVLTAVWLAQSGGHVSKRQWVGLTLGFVGLVLVVSRKFVQGHPGDSATWGNVGAAAVALAGITVGTLYQKRYVKPCDVRTANTVQLMAALAVSFPVAWLEPEAMQVNGQLMGAMVWSVLALTLGGSSLLYLLIQRGAAASVTSLMYLVPPTTAFMAWVLFAEPIEVSTVIGTALTAVGVSLVVRTPKTV